MIDSLWLALAVSSAPTLLLLSVLVQEWRFSRDMDYLRALLTRRPPVARAEVGKHFDLPWTRPWLAIPVAERGLHL
jgi:hypothetical protein